MTGGAAPWHWLAGLALLGATPAVAEGPPPGFDGPQYVDAQGCVFARTPDGWAARRNRDGSPVCGYPPSLTEGTPAPDAAPPVAIAETPKPTAPPVSAPLAPAAPKAAGAAAAPPAAETREPDAPLASAPVAPTTPEVAAVPPAADTPIPEAPLVSAPPLGSTAPEAAPCALIGLSPDGRIAAGPARAYGAAGTPAACAPPDADDFTAGHRLTRQPDHKPGAKARATRQQRAVPSAPRPPEPAPGHRFVQIGSYGDPTNGARAVSRILGMGLPAARGKGRIGNQPVEVIYAGPFDDPAALRAALLRLRAVGYPDAFTR